MLVVELKLDNQVLKILDVSVEPTPSVELEVINALIVVAKMLLVVVVVVLVVDRIFLVLKAALVMDSYIDSETLATRVVESGSTIIIGDPVIISSVGSVVVTSALLDD